MKNGILRDRYKNEKNLKFFDRDRFNSCHIFLVDDSGSNEGGKSKEVIQCSSSTSSVSKTRESPRETISNLVYNPGQSENQSSNEIIMGASFLVQLWEARSQQSSSSKSQSLIHSRTSSRLSLYENSNSSSFSENNNDNNVEIDSCSQSDSYEEKEGSWFLQLVTCTPRIRGRQASEDFLMMITRDREKELDWLTDLCAVSKFSSRRCRRLQYMLGIRNLERCISIQERHRKKIFKKPVLSEVAGDKNGFKKNPKIGMKATEEKERARETIEKDNAKESLETNKTSLSIAEKVNIWDSKEKTNKINTTEEANNEGKTARRIIDVETIESTRKKVEVSSCEEGKSIENEEYGISFQEVTSVTSLDKRKEAETTTHQSGESSKKEKSSQDDEETLKSEKQEPLEISVINLGSLIYLNDWDESEEHGEYSDEGVYYDWASKISQPKSYWDDLRKQRELEIMNNDSKKYDIQILIQRTVSNFLASHFREKIDKILNSHAQRRLQEDINPVDKEEENRKESLVECSARYQEN